MLIISCPSNFTASFLMIALPMLLTNVLFASMAEDNSMLKERFAVPGMMMSSLQPNQQLLSLVNLTGHGVVSDNYFLSGSFYSLRCSEGAFWVSLFSVFHVNRGLYCTVAYMKNYSYLWTISYDIII